MTKKAPVCIFKFLKNNNNNNHNKINIMVINNIQIINNNIVKKFEK